MRNLEGSFSPQHTHTNAHISDYYKTNWTYVEAHPADSRIFLPFVTLLQWKNGKSAAPVLNFLFFGRSLSYFLKRRNLPFSSFDSKFFFASEKAGALLLFLPPHTPYLLQQHSPSISFSTERTVLLFKIRGTVGTVLVRRIDKLAEKGALSSTLLQWFPYATVKRGDPFSHVTNNSFVLLPHKCCLLQLCNFFRAEMSKYRWNCFYLFTLYESFPRAPYSNS